MFSRPSFTLEALIKRYDAEGIQDAGDVAATICTAIRDHKLPITARFPRDTFLDEHFPAKRGLGEQSRLLTGMSTMPPSVQGHIKDVAEGLAKPDFRFDFRNIIIEREAFKAWLESEGYPLPSFWFESSAANKGQPDVRPTKRINDKRATAMRHEVIRKLAAEKNAEALLLGKAITKTKIAKQVAEQITKEHPDWEYKVLSIRRILAEKVR